MTRMRMGERYLPHINVGTKRRRVVRRSYQHNGFSGSGLAACFLPACPLFTHLPCDVPGIPPIDSTLWLWLSRLLPASFLPVHLSSFHCLTALLVACPGRTPTNQSSCNTSDPKIFSVFCSFDGMTDTMKFKLLALSFSCVLGSKIRQNHLRPTQVKRARAVVVSLSGKEYYVCKLVCLNAWQKDISIT